jgi:hypothetical protein
VSKSRVLVFSKQMQSYMTHHKGLCCCPRCMEPLVVGEQVFSRTSHRGRSKHYHLDCWRSMQFEA